VNCSFKQRNLDASIGREQRVNECNRFTLKDERGFVGIIYYTPRVVRNPMQEVRQEETAEPFASAALSANLNTDHYFCTIKASRENLALTAHCTVKEPHRSL